MYDKIISDMLPYMSLSGQYKRASEAQKMVNNAGVLALISEYKLIRQKKSVLSRKERDLIVKRIERLIKAGEIVIQNA